MDPAHQTLSLDDLIEFDAAKRIRKRLMLAEKIEVELLCYEPGQGTVEHQHVGQDEIFYVVDGRGFMTVDGNEIAVAKNDMIYVPAETRHALQCADDSRMVLVFFQAPGRQQVRQAAE